MIRRASSVEAFDLGQHCIGVLAEARRGASVPAHDAGKTRRLLRHQQGVEGRVSDGLKDWARTDLIDFAAPTNTATTERLEVTLRSFFGRPPVAGRFGAIFAPTHS